MEAKIKLLGLKPKFKKCGVAPTYCSSVFIPVDSAGQIVYVLVPELMRKLSKMGWTMNPLPRGVFPKSRMKENAMSNMHNSLMPVGRIINDYYASLECDRYRERVFNVHGLFTPGTLQICRQTFLWFQAVYGLDDNQIGELEDFMSSALSLSQGREFLWAHPLADAMYKFYHGL